jgi:hypothetical protein
MKITHPQNVFKKREKVNMSDDLVKRLRAEGIAELDEAADRIEKLEAALREIVAWPTTVKAKMVKIARKALEEKDD